MAEIQSQIMELCTPQRILLFGSYAKGTATTRSDIDLCIVADTDSKRGLLTELYSSVASSLPIDFLLYTPEEWAAAIADDYSFAHKLDREGITIYERQPSEPQR